MSIQDQVVLFSPETFNLAETTRCLETAKQMPTSVKCIFSGYSDKFSYLITEAGFDFYPLAPRMSDKDILEAMAFDQGKSLKNPFNASILRQRVKEETNLINEMNVSVVVIGSTLSMLISARVCKVKIVYIKPYSYSKAHLLQLKQPSETLRSKIIGHVFLKMTYIPKGFRTVTREFNIQPFTKTIDLVEADYNLITTLPELINNSELPADYTFIGPVYAKINGAFQIREKITELCRKARRAGVKSIYFAMGSSANKKIILKILKSLKNMSVTVIAPVKIYLTADEIQQFNDTNIHLFDWLPAVEVGELVDFSIIHGGEGTIQTACLSGKPFLGIGLQLEQKENLKAYQTFGNAKILKKINSRTIYLGIEELTNNPAYLEKATIMKSYMEQANGAQNAATFLISILT